MDEKRVMVVDDESQVLNMYTKAFTKAGYAVQSATSAEQAIAMLPKKPCMVFFLDLHMPDIDGLELCRRIRKQWPMSICFAVTGFASLYELTDCREAGFEDLFIKPLSVSVLIEAAQRAFEKIERWKSN
jgi:CheY-like chemotaxis protein